MDRIYYSRTYTDTNETGKSVGIMVLSVLQM